MSFVEWAANKIGLTTERQLTERIDAIEKAPTTFTPESLFLSGKDVVFGSQGGIEAAYDNSWVAHSCINRLATDAAGVPLKLLSDPEDPDSELPPNHPTAKLFRHPNPYFSTSEFIQSIMIWLQLRGEWFIMFDDPIRPNAMYQYTDPKFWKINKEGNEIGSWEYRRTQEHHVVSPDGIIHHRFIDPSNPYRGQPPLRAAAMAYGIDTGADTLQRNVVERGGERAVLYEAPENTSRQQRNQAITMLRQRRTEKDKVGRDVILPNGVKVIDPKFIEDDLKILQSQLMQPDKICAVYGLSKSLLGFEDIDKYATFQGRVKVYFHQTLLPQLHGVEDAFDKFFVDNSPPKLRAYVRFDYSKVTALQENAGEQFEVAGKAHAAGLPWAALNDRFNLKLDLDMVPGNEAVLVSSALAPIERLIDEWNNPASGSPSPAGGSSGAVDGGERSLTEGPALTNTMIEKRARNPRNYLQRQRRMWGYEKELRKEWKKLIFAAYNKSGTTPDSIEKQRKPTRKAARTLTRTYHERGALEGEQSIIELTEGKMDDQTLSIWKGKHKWRGEVEEWFDVRQNNIVDDTIDDLFDDVKRACTRAIKDGKGVGEVQRVIKGRFESAPGGINRAITIARTELGSAFNFARFAEIKGQGFESTRWITAGDENVRSDPFNHAGCHDVTRPVGKGDASVFPCGLEYPMQEGGDAGNVINCRCETIPFLGG